MKQILYHGLPYRVIANCQFYHRSTTILHSLFSLTGDSNTTYAVLALADNIMTPIYAQQESRIYHDNPILYRNF